MKSNIEETEPVLVRYRLAKLDSGDIVAYDECRGYESDPVNPERLEFIGYGMIYQLGDKRYYDGRRMKFYRYVRKGLA